MSQNRCSFKYRSTMGGQRRHSPPCAHRRGGAAQLFGQLRARVCLSRLSQTGRRVAPHSVGDAPRFALVEHLHEGGCKPRKLRESRSRHRRAPSLPWSRSQSSPVQPVGKGGPEVLQGACGGGGGDGYDALLAEAQRVGQRGPQGGAHRADNMMAASGVVSLISPCSFVLFPCLQKYGARPYPPIHRLRKDAPKSTNGLRSG